MRILFLTNDDEGIYKFRKEVVKKLLEENEVYISLPYGKYIPLLQEMGCKFIETNFNRKGTNPIKDLELLKTYKSMLKEIRPDVVLTYTIKPSVYGGLACKATKTPYIVNITGLGSAIENGGLLQFISLTLYRLGISKASTVFFQNTFNKEFMIKKGVVREKQAKLIPGSGVNLKEYLPLDYPKDDKINFCFIGRMMEEKGFGLYLDAAKYINEKHPNTRFHVAGEYEYGYKKEETEELIKKNIIIYHGSVMDMVNEIYKPMNCIVHPTYYAEGLSNVLLEACACARPIITTNRPGCREVVDDGINGYVVNQKDLKDLVDKIETFINLDSFKKEEMGIKGREKVEKEFNREIVVQNYVDAINNAK